MTKSTTTITVAPQSCKLLCATFHPSCTAHITRRHTSNLALQHTQLAPQKVNCTGRVSAGGRCPLTPGAALPAAIICEDHAPSTPTRHLTYTYTAGSRASSASTEAPLSAAEAASSVSTISGKPKQRSPGLEHVTFSVQYSSQPPSNQLCIVSQRKGQAQCRRRLRSWARPGPLWPGPRVLRVWVGLNILHAAERQWGSMGFGV